MRRHKIYLDNCCYNRPYDDQGSMSVFLETQAKLAIQEEIKDGRLDMYWSFMLDYENSENPDPIVKEEILTWKSLASVMINNNNSVITSALRIADHGFKKKDALHLACAIDKKVEYFITVDKGIINKKKYILEIKIVNPIEFINILEAE
ncbi:MAG: PIN domain protein [Candidatus Delongbacteria bacterium]|jgi:predicted nucleic acid-binding protein